MAKIIKDRLYPDIKRRHIVAVLNPTEPQFMHSDGSPHPDVNPLFAPDGGIHGCYNTHPMTGMRLSRTCRYNWREVSLELNGKEFELPNSAVEARIRAIIRAATASAETGLLQDQVI